MRILVVTILAFIGLALAAAPQRELQRAQRELSGLIGALAQDGVRLDFDHPRVTSLGKNPDSVDVAVDQLASAGPRAWRGRLRFWLDRGRRKHTSLELEAVNPEASPYRIRSVTMGLDDSQILPWVYADGTPPGECPAYRKAGQRIFARQLPATYAYLKASRQSRRLWSLLGLLPTLALGVFLTFFWAARPERYLRWMNCKGLRWWKCGVSFLAAFLLTYLNYRLASSEAVFVASMYLVWVLTASGVGAQIYARAGSGRLAGFFKRALIMTSLAMLVVVLFGILAPPQNYRFTYEAVFCGFLAASYIWVVAFGRLAG